MNLFRFISRAALHIFSCRRWLVWNLLACCICVSCSYIPTKYGGNKTYNINDNDNNGEEKKVDKEDKDLFAALKEYCKIKGDDNKNEEKKIMKCFYKYFIQNCSNKDANGDNIIHCITSLHSNKDVSNTKQEFLKGLYNKVIDILVEAKRLSKVNSNAQENNREMFDTISDNLDLVNQQNNNGETPLEIAVNDKNIIMVMELISRTNTDLIINNLKILEYLISVIGKGGDQAFAIKKLFFDEKNINNPPITAIFLEKVAHFNFKTPQLDSYLNALYLLAEYDSAYRKYPYPYEFNPKLLDKPTCPICYTKEESCWMIVKKCKHPFHALCFAQFMYNESKNNQQPDEACPMCREKIFPNKQEQN